MIGIDIVEHSRVAGATMEFVNRVLSDDELKIYDAITNAQRKLNYLASRLACKEAIFKAFKSGDKSLNYRDLSILNREDGSPYLSSIVIKDEVELSISHSENYSVGLAIRK